MDSETNISSDSNYNEFANEVPFVGNILQPFESEAIFTAAEIWTKKRPIVLHHITWWTANSLGGVHGQKLKNGCGY